MLLAQAESFGLPAARLEHSRTEPQHACTRSLKPGSMQERLHGVTRAGAGVRASFKAAVDNAGAERPRIL